MGKLKELISKYESNSFYLLFIGLLAAMFFTATFLINRSISIDGGHWFWSGALRFIITIFLMALVIVLFRGINFFIDVLKDYKEHFIFWNIAGTLGFGIFYSMICFAADFSAAWMVATTWQLTIICSLFVLAFYGKKLSKKVWFFTFFIFLGVCLVNFNSFDINELKSTFIGFIAVLIAAFAYPIGNQMVWEEKSKRHKKLDFKTHVLENAFAKVFLMTLGSFPVWLVLYFMLEIDFMPTNGQVLSVIIISLLSGVIATSLFLYARSKADNSKKIMLVDAAQSGEVVFALAGEILFLNLIFPSFIAITGVIITIFGLVMITKIED